MNLSAAGCALCWSRAVRDDPVMASGGVRNVEHLRELADLKVEAAIVGRALYEGELALAEALAVVAS